jgi:hypothetical protein
VVERGRHLAVGDVEIPLLVRSSFLGGNCVCLQRRSDGRIMSSCSFAVIRYCTQTKFNPLT